MIIETPHLTKFSSFWSPLETQIFEFNRKTKSAHSKKHWNLLTIPPGAENIGWEIKTSASTHCSVCYGSFSRKKFPWNSKTLFNKTLRCIAIISADGEENGFKTKLLKLTKITWTTLRENRSLLGKHNFKQNLAILKIHFWVSARFFRARWKKDRFLQIYIFLGLWGKNKCCCQNWFLCVERSFLRTKDLLKKIWNMSFFPKLKELFGLLFSKLIATRSKE